MDRIIVMLVMGVLLASVPVLPKTVPDCPEGGSGNAVFHIVDEGGRPLSGATLLFTAGNWDHVTADAVEEPRPVRIVMRPRAGRYVRVTHGGAPVPRVAVTIADSGRDPRTFQTDIDGVARYPELTADGEAIFEVALAGFVSQRAHVTRDRKNGPLIFEIPIAQFCAPMQVH